MRDQKAGLADFRTPRAFREWLAAHHASESELLVRCYKVHAAQRGMTYAQVLDEALCFGWIDGVRRGVDEDTFSIRLTPRKATSIWSRVNIAHVERLSAAGRMAPAGLEAFARRTPERAGIYSFERQTPLSPAFVKAFRAKKAAWAYYQAQPPGYRRTTAHWVMSAKQEPTRQRRLALLADCSGRGEPIPLLDRRRR